MLLVGIGDLPAIFNPRVQTRDYRITGPLMPDDHQGPSS